MTNIPNIGIFATGSPEGGGSGARKLLEAVDTGFINARVATIVSNYPNGGVVKIAEDFSEDFKLVESFPKREEDGEFSDVNKEVIKKIYLEIMTKYELDYIFLSGWMKQVLGLPANRTINIHPGPTQKPYGGKGMYGSHVHEKVWEDFQDGKIQRSCVTMHYVTDGIDEGPIIAQVPVDISDCTSAEEIGEKVNKKEHEIQYLITELVASGQISWSGIAGEPVVFPDWYNFSKEIDLTKLGEDNAGWDITSMTMQMYGN